MCGIAGIIGRIGDKNRAALTRMADSMAHRGPDSTGYWTGQPDENGTGCMLAHRRLSILDLTTAADQPMTDPHGGQTLIFNGEIYNFRELRESLISRGEKFESTGDTAVMLRSLSLDGTRTLPSLRGMYAFAPRDDRTRQLLLAHDPLGIKPLYIAKNPDPNGDWKLIFASEVRAILGSGLLEKPKLNPDAVASVLWNGFVVGPATIVRGIESMWPGQYITFDGKGRQTSTEFFWSIGRDNNKPDVSESELREAIRESVRLHLVSDVPLGVFLSSGVDSSAVANLAQKVSDRPVNTFTLAFEEESLNEGEHAKRIAAAIGTQHREIVLSEDRFVANIERALDTLDQPTFDGLNSFYMSQAVREAGLTVALVGTGGDELFGGYKSFRELPTLMNWDKRSSMVPRPIKRKAAEAIAWMAQGRSGTVGPQTRWAKLPDMIASGPDVISLYQLAYALFLPEFQGELMPGSSDRLRDGLPAAFRDRLMEETDSRSVLSAIAVLEQRCFLAERLLRDSDAASMAVSLEMRLPLVDQVLVERVNRMRDDDRFNPIGQKSILRRIGLEGLDPKLFDRPKSGFVLPFDKWIRRGLGSTMDETMRDERAAASVGLNGKAVNSLWQTFNEGGAGMYWSRVWAIFVLMRWCARHGVTI